MNSDNTSSDFIDWKRFTDIIRQSQNIVLVSHIRPDCDALGSELGMAHVLRALGKSVRIVNGQSTPPNLAFIDPQQEILAMGHDVTAADLADADLFLILDTSARIQLGKMAEVLDATAAKKVILDHHVSQDELGAEIFKRTTAEATGCLVVEAARELGVSLTAAAARPLFAAVATDTGWFRFGSVGPGTFAVGAELMKAGAVPAEIYNQLYEQETVGRTRLRGIVLERTIVECAGRFAHTYIRAEDFSRSGALPSDTEDLINETLAIAGTQFAVILVEQSTGGFKISFRSRCALECNQVAAAFGGGGHKAAAGAFIKGEFSDVQRQVLDHVRQQLG